VGPRADLSSVAKGQSQPPLEIIPRFSQRILLSLIAMLTDLLVSYFFNKYMKCIEIEVGIIVIISDHRRNIDGGLKIVKSRLESWLLCSPSHSRRL
jgi:hypothetical protein